MGERYEGEKANGEFLNLNFDNASERGRKCSEW